MSIFSNHWNIYSLFFQCLEKEIAQNADRFDAENPLTQPRKRRKLLPLQSVSEREWASGSALFYSKAVV